MSEHTEEYESLEPSEDTEELPSYVSESWQLMFLHAAKILFRHEKPQCDRISCLRMSHFPAGQGAKHGPWEDPTFTESTSAIHAPRYFKEYEVQCTDYRKSKVVHR